MEQRDKEILSNLISLLEQLKKDKIAGEPYISRFSQYLRQHSIQDMIDLVANWGKLQSPAPLQMDRGSEIKGNRCSHPLQGEYHAACHEEVSIDLIISALHNDKVIKELSQIIYNYLMVKTTREKSPVNPVDGKATLSNRVNVDLITDGSTAENPTISPQTQQHMEQIIQTYYKNEDAYRSEWIRLVLRDAEERAGHPQPFQSMEKAKTIPLQQTLGNAKLWAIQDDGNRYLVVPTKHMKLSYSAILKNGLDEFFEFESPDNLSGNYNSFTLKKPAIFEKRDDFYYVVARGQIKVEN